MPRQIGWSQESNLLYNINNQLSSIAGIIAASGGGGTITGGGAAGQIAFWDAATNITGSNNLFWDNVNKRMGIGTNTPLTTAAGYTVLALNGAAGAGGVLEFQTNGVRIATINNNSLQLDLETKIAGPITFGTNGTERFRVSSNGNLLIGTPTDGGQRLQVTGTSQFTGTTTIVGQTVVTGTDILGSTQAFVVRNSVSTNSFVVTNAGDCTIRSSLNLTGGNLNVNNILSGVNQNLTISAPYANNNVVTIQAWFGSDRQVLINSTGNIVRTSGTNTILNVTEAFIPPSGNAISNLILVNPTINQTSGATGITRGLYVNPTLAAAADFRAIETTDGKVIFANLPTSSAGLPAGSLWNNGGVVNIV
jgi:hypothetical protein